MKTKMILVVSAAVLILAAFLGYRIDNFTTNEQNHMAQELSKKQSQFLLKSVESLVKDAKTTLVDITKMEELKVKMSDKNLGDFPYVMAIEDGRLRWKLQ